jgi:hypothetical protein
MAPRGTTVRDPRAAFARHRESRVYADRPRGCPLTNSRLDSGAHRVLLIDGAARPRAF